MGEGAGILILESLEHALDRGATPLAELIGYGATADAYHITQPAPEGEGGARAMRMAMKKAGLSPKDVDYINAHGTSTPMNDNSRPWHQVRLWRGGLQDTNQLHQVHDRPSPGGCRSAGAAISVLAICNGAIPPTINLEEPDPDCDLDYTPYMPRRGKVSAVISNSLGFGGHNTCLAFRSYEG